jgi:hypothetical protein
MVWSHDTELLTLQNLPPVIQIAVHHSLSDKITQIIHSNDTRLIEGRNVEYLENLKY